MCLLFLSRNIRFAMDKTSRHQNRFSTRGGQVRASFALMHWRYLYKGSNVPHVYVCLCVQLGLALSELPPDQTPKASESSQRLLDFSCACKDNPIKTLDKCFDTQLLRF